MRKILGAALLVLTATTAHAGSLPGFVLAAQTPHVSFYSRGEGVDAQKVERRVAELERLFGHRLGRRVNYYRYGSPQEVAAGTGHYAAGVTFAAAAEVHSTEAFHDHELVHVVAGQLGDPGAFFQEGLAVAVGNKGRWQGRPADALARRAGEVDLKAMVTAFDRFEADTAYAVAGSFVSWLVRTHGLEQVAAYFRACRPGADPLAEFTRSFGQSLEAAAESWRRAL